MTWSQNVDSLRERSYNRKMFWAKKALAIGKQHKYFIGLFIFSALFLAWLNPLVWPVNDEYLYAITGNAVYQSLTTQAILLSDINTEHTPLLSFLIAGYIWLTGSDAILDLRIISIVCALASILVYYRLFIKLQFSPRTAVLMLTLLLLITDFWIYSVRLVLVPPAVLCFGILIYLLLNEGSKTKLALTLTILLLFNEYYFYLASGFLCVYQFLRIALPSQKPRVQRLVDAIRICAASVIPGIILIFILIDFNIFPYPRLLENSLGEVFADSFRIVHRQLVAWWEPLINWVNHPYPVIELSKSVIQSAPKEITPLNHQIVLTGDVISSNIIDSPIGEVNTTDWLRKYTYNFSDIYINPLILIFALFGIAQRVYVSYQKKFQFDAIQVDLIFILLTSLFVFFNIQQGGTEHGFRILMPIIPALLYFNYHGLAIALNHRMRWYEYSGLTLLFVSAMLIYWHNTMQFEYRSALTGGIISHLLNYKPVIFIVLWTIIFVFILLHHHIQWRYRPLLLGCILLGLWGLKFIPYYPTHIANSNYFGYEYSLAEAAPYLKATNGSGLITNLYFHQSYYWSDNIEIPNQSAQPAIRTFAQSYALMSYNLGERFEADIIPKAAKKEAKYIFLYQAFYGQEYKDGLQKFFDTYHSYMRPIKIKTIDNRFQWGLYYFDYRKYNTDHP